MKLFPHLGPSSAVFSGMRPLFVLLVLSLQGLHAGAIISVNLDEALARRSMKPSDRAGATGDIRVANWNNLICGKTQPKPDTALVYADGKPVGTGFVIQWDLRPTWVAALPAPVSDDAALFAGYSEIITSGAVTFSGIPFAKYDIYVYVRSGHARRGGSVSLGSEKTFYYRGGVQRLESGADYIAARSTVYDPQNPSAVEPANYVLFSQLEGASQTIQLDALDMGHQMLRLMACGFQIVER